MCMPAKCANCDKKTWMGCGKHIDSVMSKVPEEEACKCSPEERTSTAWSIIVSQSEHTNDEVKLRATCGDAW